MQLKSLAAMALIGMTGCLHSERTNLDDSVFLSLDASISDLETALLAHPETPTAVGEAAVDVIIGYRTGFAQ